tara:strand:- start:63010 stop:63282 length:273 start_codon:yes stop_codon:yes gene_type:complete
MNEINKKFGIIFLIMCTVWYICGSFIYTEREREYENVTELSWGEASKIIKNPDKSTLYYKHVYITELQTKTMIPFVYETKEISRIVKYKS